MFLPRLLARHLAPCLALVMLTAPAFAQDLFPRTAPAVFDVARSFGEIEFVEPDSDGRPVLHGEIDGIYYSMVIFGCDAPDGCESVQFYASFISEDNSTLSFVNQWNNDKRWVTAFLEPDGDVVIAMTANIRHGVTRQNFMDSFDIWTSLMTEFNDRIYNIGNGPAVPPGK